MSEISAQSQHALSVIEFDRVLALVAEKAVSAYGAEKVLASRPRTDAAWIAAELERVRQLRLMLETGEHWQVRSIPDLRTVFRRLGVAGSTLEGADVFAIGVLLASSRICASQLNDDATGTDLRAALRSHTAVLLHDAGAERAISRAIGEDGAVLDTASPALRKIRRELASHTQQIVTLLQRIVGSLEPHQRVADASVTVRGGRYVIPVRREAKSSVGGIVHGTSATGATLFIEPPAAIEHGNRMRELESEERGEVDRILLELTELLRPHTDSLAATLESLAELDSLVARASFGVEFRGAPFPLGEPGDSFRIIDGRHPLLIAQGIAVVPFSLEVAPEERTVLISGPNTGGKTVLLKSVALLCAMAQSGIPATVGEGSTLPLFDDFFADVGDEQSIQASLSTFSAHLRNISGILRHANARSLVLMDEVGSGTDPVEGAALAAAVLEDLTQRGTFTLATTHLGALQQLATEVPGVVNASLQFDSARLEPTYRFIKGIPGRSYGLSIARRLGLPTGIVDNAERRVPEGERKLAALIADLEERERALSVREKNAEADAAGIVERAHHIAERELKLREERREFERESRKLARRHLLDAREEVERTIRELRAAQGQETDNAAKNARRRIEDLAAEHDEGLRQLDELEARAPVARHGVVEPGDAVVVDTLGGREGTLLEIRGSGAIVALGALKVTVPLGALARAPAAKKPKEVVTIRGELPDQPVKSEIDIRGMRVDEVDQALIPALDAAARADLRIFRIIHGKGTGALRSRVQEILARDSRVASSRDGAWNEGGTGVTVAELS